MTTKICSKCGQEKTLDLFYHNAKSKDGHRPNCRTCSNVPARKKSPQEKFWKHINKSTNNGCWEWTAGLNTQDGYGRIKNGAGHILVHRLSWQVHFGEIPAGLFVCHKCDNPKCVNPDHLFLGTNQDNILDMERKGRGKHPTGESCPSSKLTLAQVVEIRSLYATGDYSQRDIATMYKVHQPCIKDIVNRITWKCAP